MDWKETYDVVVVGSGAGGLVSAITAKNNGLKTLLIEKAEYVGGSSALSGGGLWIPNNHVSKNAGLEDSEDEALLYMETVIEHQGASSSRARKEAFVKNGPKMVKYLEDLGIEWLDGILYPDYYPEKPGGKIGRSIECKVFNTKELGEHEKLLLKPNLSMPFPIYSGKVAPVPRAFTNLKDFSTVTGMVMNGLKLKVKRQNAVSIGQALIGRLLKIAISSGVTIRVSTSLKDIILEENSIKGVIIEHEGIQSNISCKAVIFASGGFEHNIALRKKYHNLDEEWSSGTLSNTGDLLALAAKYNLDTELLDDAWWGPTLIAENGAPHFMVYERSLPHSIIVDGNGERYFNESESYVDAGHAMLKQQKKNGKSIPSWIILESRFRKRYLFGMHLPNMTPKSAYDSGFLVKADSLEQLAAKTGIDFDGLKTTIERFNSFVANGVDEDFGRGNSAYDRYYGDPSYQNPNLGEIIKPPFYASKVYPGDLGTKGGFVANEFSEVLSNGQPVKGLYATGNCSASVMGRTYPGPGSTLGPATTFGYIAANHIKEMLFSPLTIS